jgi:hypothetical protein
MGKNPVGLSPHNKITTRSPYRMDRDPVLSEYIYQMAELPPQLPILLETVEQHDFVARHGAIWQDMSLWMRHLLLGEALAEEIYLTNTIALQPRAELMAAEFKLAVGVHPRSAHPIICQFDSPAGLWFACQIQLSYGLLEHKGLLEPPRIIGKTERLNGTRRFIDLLENQKFADWEGERATSQSVQLILVTEAQDIAKTDSNFAATYYNPFLRQFKRTVNAEKKNKQLQDLYLLPDGQLYQTRKNKKLPPGKCKEK